MIGVRTFFMLHLKWPIKPCTFGSCLCANCVLGNGITEIEPKQMLAAHATCGSI